jgi:hypothetical protein
MMMLEMEICQVCEVGICEGRRKLDWTRLGWMDGWTD